MKSGGALSPSVPSCKVPSASKQKSGATKHARMTTAAKVEKDSNLPKIS